MCEGWSLEIGMAFRGSVVRRDMGPDIALAFFRARSTRRGRLSAAERAWLGFLSFLFFKELVKLVPNFVRQIGRAKIVGWNCPFRAHMS
jgi:hypothetical protein